LILGYIGLFITVTTNVSRRALVIQWMRRLIVLGLTSQPERQFKPYVNRDFFSYGNTLNSTSNGPHRIEIPDLIKIRN